jgi:hypothetical protein
MGILYHILWAPPPLICYDRGVAEGRDQCCTKTDQSVSQSVEGSVLGQQARRWDAELEVSKIWAGLGVSTD